MTGIVSLGVAARALEVCEQRATLIAKNLANSSTPNYKAQDINFQETMQQAGQTTLLASSNAKHVQSSDTTEGMHLYYRVPMQAKMDNNTVDDEIERKNFAENAVRYQASISLIEKQANELIRAVRGE